MSFYSYKNSNSTHCPCTLNGSEVLNGLNEKVCIQVQRVYDSCLQQEQALSILSESSLPLFSSEGFPCSAKDACLPKSLGCLCKATIQ